MRRKVICCLVILTQATGLELLYGQCRALGAGTQELGSECGAHDCKAFPVVQPQPYRRTPHTGVALGARRHPPATPSPHSCLPAPQQAAPGRRTSGPTAQAPKPTARHRLSSTRVGCYLLYFMEKETQPGEIQKLGRGASGSDKRGSVQIIDVRSFVTCGKQEGKLENEAVLSRGLGTT
ncbi:unnamed protein product [Nyctereutes procyonoides]|uniref:(raccoon dog) hypothetical protein n=1 Tax=Nyctereutes procyonoides TaxID=34880 RepID=A0A811ZI85_NYCPR|nr:unnamed protein product [Nyctereutes procyonoides]